VVREKNLFFRVQFGLLRDFRVFLWPGGYKRDDFSSSDVVLQGVSWFIHQIDMSKEQVQSKFGRRLS
jgi:hypothetical protein